jgi:hypothetical protein
MLFKELLLIRIYHTTFVTFLRDMALSALILINLAKKCSQGPPAAYGIADIRIIIGQQVDV